MARRVLSRRIALAGIAAAAAGPALRPARGAAFPERAVRLVVPYSVGIGPDVVARSVAEQLARRWDQPVVVDNKPGASGILAFGEVRRTPPDGHTLYLADTATLAINPLLHATLPYDPASDLLPLTLLFRATFAIWVGGGNRMRDLAELLQSARSAPGKVSYATLGHGHASHMAVEGFARAAGVTMLHVPFKDAGAMLAAVASSEVDFTTVSVNTAAGLMVSGRLRPLAVAARMRLRDHPTIPTVTEAGGPPVHMHPWAGLVTVAATPVPVMDRLQRDLAAVLASPEVRSRADQAGFELTPSAPEGLREQVQADLALYAPLVAEGRVRRLSP
jgi:tripartite-type tricarboxylate transporter receptor subunit TctC